MLDLAISKWNGTPDSVPRACESCAALCCRDKVISLSLAEHDRMRAGGTTLQTVPKEARQGQKPPRATDFYRMVGSCGFLDASTDLCTDYANRPQACRE